MSRVLRRTALLACAGAALITGCSSASPAPVDRVTDAHDNAGGSDGVGSAGLGGAGGAGDAPAPSCDELSATLQGALDGAMEAQRLPGVAAAVHVGGCSWLGAAGVADAEANLAMQPGDLFRVGSITKTFVAALALMLRAEGRLSLDDAVSRYVDGVPRGEQAAKGLPAL